VLLYLLLRLRRWCLCLWRGFGGVVDAESEGRGWSDRYYARSEFYADCYVVVWGEAAFTEPDCELEGVSTLYIVQRAEVDCVHSIYRILNLLATQSSLCSPMAESCGIRCAEAKRREGV
jgi:hypothetical protein